MIGNLDWPNNPLELTAHSAGFLGIPGVFLLWAAAQRERYAAFDAARVFLSR